MNIIDGWLYSQFAPATTGWAPTTQPGGGVVKSITLKGTTLYAGMADGTVKFSINAGTTWITTNANPNGSNQVNTVFMSNFILN